jgi:hypothetical protein
MQAERSVILHTPLCELGAPCSCYCAASRLLLKLNDAGLVVDSDSGKLPENVLTYKAVNLRSQPLADMWEEGRDVSASLVQRSAGDEVSA